MQTQTQELQRLYNDCNFPKAAQSAAYILAHNDFDFIKHKINWYFKTGNATSQKSHKQPPIRFTIIANSLNEFFAKRCLCDRKPEPNTHTFSNVALSAIVKKW